MNSFIWLLVVTIPVGAMYLWYLWKKDPTASGRNGGLWTIHVMSLCFGIAIFFSGSFVSYRTSPIDISLDDSQEVKIQKLIRKDDVNTRSINEMQEVNQFLTYAIGIFLLAFVAPALDIVARRR